jgi:hypothetical protein
VLGICLTGLIKGALPKPVILQLQGLDKASGCQVTWPSPLSSVSLHLGYPLERGELNTAEVY